MHLQIVYDTLPLIFILILVLVTAGLLRIRRDGVVRILVLVEGAEHSLHLLLVHRLQLFGLQVGVEFVHQLFGSVVVRSQTLGLLPVLVHPRRHRIDLLVLLGRAQHVRKTLLVRFD